MTISDERTLAEVQREFHEKFPFLKLAFYSTPHKTGEGSQNKALINETKTIGEVRTVHNTGDLSINGHLKVSTLEQQFAEVYGLNVQVFRKSGSIWLQTITTDDWTLSAQNKKGEEYLAI
jgi:hypothetical protein